MYIDIITRLYIVGIFGGILLGFYINQLIYLISKKTYINGFKEGLNIAIEINRSKNVK